MAQSPHRRGSRRYFSPIRLKVIALVTAVSWLVVFSWTPVVLAASAVSGGELPAIKLFSYARGPAQHHGTAAGKAHYVPASATRAKPALAGVRGHRAPKPHLAPSPIGTPALAHTRSARRGAGHEIVGHKIARPVVRTTRPGAGGRGGTNSPAVAGPDNATYSVKSTFDTVPMADQSGRIAVTLTNTGTSTWSTDYALVALVFPASNTTGTGTPLTTGPAVTLGGSIAPSGTTTVESVTPPENPGSYTICYDMVNAAGTYFSAEGGAEFCGSYTIQQFAPVINEQEPLPGTDVDSQNPPLTVSATVPGGFPANPTFSFAFEILNGSNPSTATVLQSSGWVAGNSSSWTPTTALTWGTTYYWRVTVSDAATLPTVTGSGITWTTPISFVVGNAQAGVSATLGNSYLASDGNPIMTSNLGGANYQGSGKTVDPKTGNVSQQVTDASVATTGPELSIVRTYNSLDPRTSQAFGAGWSSMLDMSLVPDSDGTGALILTMADGQQIRFAKNSAGGYAAPQDMYAVVTAISGGGFSVTDQTGTTYAFTQASGTSWLLSKITDNTGKTLTLTYSAGVLTTITSTTSGRALHLTWSTPTGATAPHVATVATDPATAGQPSTALTWTYGYSGDLLTSVCPPGTTTACTAYGYNTSASHAATSVRNADPTSYYRLNDPASATAAANQVPVDDLTTMDPPATEMNTTPGVPGPVSGVTATSFNGTSSWIPLDGTWCTSNLASSCIELDSDTGRVVTSSSEAFSVWFKTTSASGILLGAGSGEPTLNCVGDIECNEVPLLWIGTNGHLEGLRTVISQTGTSTTPDIYASAALSSAAAVNNGAWHQAVLIPGQALYLDGTKVASGTTAATLPASDYDVLLGAGQSPGSLCSGCALGTATWEYFNGSMADLSIYQNQLPSPSAVAAQYAAETRPAAALTTITSPAGHTELSATYDTVNDRVATLTDANGGTWTYGNAVRGTSSGAYDSAVMGSVPEDFWPLNDTAGPLAHNVVDNAATAAASRPPATYSNVTLGAAGPSGFPDGTAATFNGTSSQITVPGGYFGGTGAESAEEWFKTTKTGTLLSSGAGPTGGEPLAIWIPKGADCLEGSAGSTMLNDTPIFGCAGVAVNDGKWHQAAITLSPGTMSSGTFTQTATLYQDGVVLDSEQITTQATASATGYVADLGSGPNGFFNGSIADVSLYTSELTSNQVATHFSALQDQLTPPVTYGSFGEQTGSVTLPTLNTQTITVTDPVGSNARYLYDSTGSLVQATDFRGGTSLFGYDEAQRASTITDPDGNTTYVTYDAHNNVTSTTSCVAINNCQTAYTSYFESLSNPLDPRNDKPTDERDARSTSPADPTYDTVTTYTASAQIASKTTPPTAACPSGCTTSYAYTAGTETAIGGGTEPAGLLASVTAPGGGMTKIAYDSAGDVMQTTSPTGLVTSYTYDNLGRQLTQTQISDTFPAGLTISYAYDGQERVVTETDPGVTDRVTGAVHTEVTTRTYDPDGNVLTTTLSDTTGKDPSRTTTDTYNSHGELATTADALGNTTSYTYDPLGDRVSETNPAGVTTAFTYDASGNLLTTTLDGYTGNPSDPITAENLVEESRAYDPAGHLASVTNVAGTQTNYTYFGNGQVASSYVVLTGVSGKSGVTTYAYDGANNLVSETKPGGLVIKTAYNADTQVVSQTEDPAGSDISVAAKYDRGGNVISESRTGGGVTQTETATYNSADQELSQTIDNTGGSAGSGGLTTAYTRDERGLVISQTDPDGNTTQIENDEAGRPVVQIDPAILTQDGHGDPAVMASPVTTTGYDTFGDEVEESDANGNVTTTTFDADGRETAAANPSYTPPGSTTPVNGTTTTSYNNLGEETSTSDPLGNVTTMSYDQLGDLTSKTDHGGGVSTYTYDPAGEQTSVTDPTGAQTQATYDGFGQLITSTDIVRQNTSAAYTTTYGYNDAGDLTSETSPTGVQDTATYNALGQQVSAIGGSGNTTSFTYNLDGDLAKTTLPDGTAAVTSFDLADRPVSQSYLNPAGTVLRTESVGYNGDGYPTSETDFLGNTSTATYDAIGLRTSQTEPVSASNNITVSFGYDLNGDETALTGANGNTTYTAYNSLGLPAQITEPSTAAYSSAADSTTTDSYDANGELVNQVQPGGVQVSDTYNANGDLTGQSGSGASAPTASRTFAYDADGRILTAATAAAGTAGSFGYQAPTSESFSYDDRGLLLAAAGSAGSSSFTYNGSGQQTSVTDAAGTSSFTYDSAGRLATDADAASGATGTYSYSNLDQVTQISYGPGKDTQSFGYDGLHRLTSDVVDTASGAQVSALGYGYDAAADVTSMTTTGLATPSGTGTVTNTYGYDEAGRLTSWTATPAGGSASTTSYGYDNDGNLTSSGGVTYTYDARDELTSDSNGNSSAYSANGDLISQTSSGNSETSSTSDAYGQQITDDSASSYGWDAMDRMVTAANSGGGTPISITYDGDTGNVASDSSATYSRDPAGQITGVDAAAGGPMIALDNQHGDLSGMFTASGTALAGSTTYDPWGAVLASSGPSVQVGYQGQWTDPVTQQVDMGARLYRPGGGFANQDTRPSESGVAVTDNLHAYADDNPVTLADPSGHAPAGKGSSGGPTAADVAATSARAAAATARAGAAEAAYRAAAAAAAIAQAAAHGAAALARTLNSAAARLVALAARTAKAAALAFALAQAELRVAESWQEKANEEWSAAAQDLAKAGHEPWYEPWKAADDLYHAARETIKALADEAHAALALGEYAGLELVALSLQALAALESGAAKLAELAAKGAAAAANALANAANAAERTAEALGAIARRDRAAAAAAVAAATALASAYAKELARKAAAVIKSVARKVVGTVVKAGKAVAAAASAVGGAIASTASAVGGAIATAAGAVGGAIATAVSSAGAAIIANPAAIPVAIAGAIASEAQSGDRAPDYYTGGAQVCLILCLGVSATVSKGGTGFLSVSGGYGLGASIGVQPGYIENANPQDHTNNYVNKFIGGWSAATSAGIGVASDTQTNGNLGHQGYHPWASEPGVAGSGGLSIDAGISQTWGYSFNLGRWDGRNTNNYNTALVCAHDGVCG
jgi:RHS repeat-associated protein